MANLGTVGGGIVVTFDGLTVGELYAVSRDGFRRTAVDISSAADADGVWMAFKPGKINPGTITLEVRWHSEVVNSGDVSPLFWLAKGEDDLVIKFPLSGSQTVAGQIACRAFCVGDGPPAGGMDEAASRTLIFQITGKPTYTAAS